MTIDGLGRTGIWVPHTGIDPETARELERLGFSAIWLGMSPDAGLAMVDPLLDATEHLIVGTSIVNVWAALPETVAASFYRLESEHPGRFVLGIGAGHRENDADYRKPYEAMVDYLDVLDDAGVPEERRALAALGPQMLELARSRSAGALPYLVTPGYTRTAREALGPDALLAVEQKVALGDDREQARTVGRERVSGYLRLANYVANLKRIGYDDEDVAVPGSDRLVDALALPGDADTITAGLQAHLDAGADHVAVQILTADGDLLPTARALAGRL